MQPSMSNLQRRFVQISLLIAFAIMLYVILTNNS